MKIKAKVLKAVEVDMEIDIPRTASEWRLLTDGKAGADGVAKDLGDHLESLLSKKSLHRTEVHRSMIEVMNELSFYGASDTEPRSVLADILDKVFEPNVSITINADGIYCGKIDVPSGSSEKTVINKAVSCGLFPSNICKLVFVPNQSLTIKTKEQDRFA